MYRLILVPLDGSGFAEAALRPALSISRRTGAKLHLVKAVEPIPVMAPGGWSDQVRDWAGTYLAHLQDHLSDLSGGPVSTRVLEGHPAQAIEEEIEVSQAELIVMASHGRGPLSRAWLGSVADELTRHGTRPILVVRPQEGTPEPLGTEWGISRIMVPLDGTQASEAVLAHAVELGILFDTAFHLVRVVPFPLEFSSSYFPDMIRTNHEFVEEAREDAERYLEEKANDLRALSLSVDTSVVAVPQVAHGILSEAATGDCDLIAMGTHGRGPLARTVLGSTADKVLRGTHLPLLIYRPHH